MIFKRIIVRVCILTVTLFLLSLDNQKLHKIRPKMESLIKEHQHNMPNKKFFKLEEFHINQEVIDNPVLFQNKNSTDFTYMGGRTFRFYVYAEGVDARVLLKQTADGYHERIEEKILLDVIKSGDDKDISYYDYTFKDHNDFLLTFTPENSEDGYAIMMLYTISDLED
jgi:hypothetical protein